MQQVKKVVLAYSGGVDTSVCIPYLKNEYGVSEVVTFVADLGQGEDLELIRQKALNSGASQSIVGNLVNSFVERYAFPAIRANALYLDKYPISLNNPASDNEISQIKKYFKFALSNKVFRVHHYVLSYI